MRSYRNLLLTLYCSRSRLTRRRRGGEPSVDGFLRIAMTVSCEDVRERKKEGFDFFYFSLSVGAWKEGTKCPSSPPSFSLSLPPPFGRAIPLIYFPPDLALLTFRIAMGRTEYPS